MVVAEVHNRIAVEVAEVVVFHAAVPILYACGVHGQFRGQEYIYRGNAPTYPILESQQFAYPNDQQLQLPLRSASQKSKYLPLRQSRIFSRRSHSLQCIKQNLFFKFYSALWLMSIICQDKFLDNYCLLLIVRPFEKLPLLKYFCAKKFFILIACL